MLWYDHRSHYCVSLSFVYCLHLRHSYDGKKFLVECTVMFGVNEISILQRKDIILSLSTQPSYPSRQFFMAHVHDARIASLSHTPVFLLPHGCLVFCIQYYHYCQSRPGYMTPIIDRTFHELHDISSRDSILSSHALLLTSAFLVVVIMVHLIIIILILLSTMMLTGRDPRLPVVHPLILPGQVDAFFVAPGPPPLRERTGPRRELRLNLSILLHPVRERIFAVLDDRLAGLVPIVGIARLTGSNRRIVDELEEMLAVASTNGHLFAVLAQCVELVGEGCLELFARDVGELGFRDERFGFGADEFLLEHDDLGALRLLVFELRDLVGYLLLAWKSLALV